MSCRNLLEDVETTLAEFLADLRDNIFTSDTERGDLLLVEFFFKKLPQLAKMSYIVDHLLPYKRMIDEEKAEFFIKKKDKIFAGSASRKGELLCSSSANSGESGWDVE